MTTTNEFEIAIMFAIDDLNGLVSPIRQLQHTNTVTHPPVRPGPRARTDFVSTFVSRVREGIGPPSRGNRLTLYF